VFWFLPWLDTSPVRSASFRPLYRWFFWLFALNAVALGFLGSMPAEGIYVVFALICTGIYFAFFLVVMPLLSRYEKPLQLPESISAAVLAH
jgi:ubiquinol-cytochrome c reductase cytochrome b/c1 subunit